MIHKVLSLLLVVGFTNSLYISTQDNIQKGLSSDSENWKFIKVYQTPPKQTWYKYEPYTYPKYEFEYAVSDKKTGDHKRHQEFRDGDRVHGEYELVEPDGSVRKVEYKADDHHGFNAIVSKGIHKHGEHAYSVFGHTAFFHPLGHSIKVNNYFPEQKSNNNINEKTDIKEKKIIDDNIKPVVETAETQKMVKDELGSNMMVSIPNVSMASTMEINKEVKATEEQVLIPKEISKDMADVVSMVMQIQPESQNVVMETAPMKQQIEIEAAKPVMVTEDTKIPIDNTKEVPKNDPIPDSSVASSYYHSKIYYGYL